MIEPSKLPYIDLGCDAEILKQYALDHFGKKISAQAKDETVVSRFKAIYFEETGVTLAEIADVSDPDEDDADEDTDETTTPAKDKKPQPIAVTIIVQDDEKDPHPIVGGVQFVPYRIVRNVEVRVSIPQLTSLRNAMKTVYNPETMEPKQVPMYPFSIVDHHFE